MPPAGPPRLCRDLPHQGLYLAVGAEPEHALAGWQLLQPTEKAGPPARGIGPDPPKELHVLGIQPLGAPRRHVRAPLSPGAEGAQERPAQTRPARQVQEDHCVPRGQPEVERPSVVAVQDPGIPRHQGLLDAPPLLPWRLLPTRAPIQGVQVDHLQAQDPTQAAGTASLLAALLGNMANVPGWAGGGRICDGAQTSR